MSSSIGEHVVVLVPQLGQKCMVSVRGVPEFVQYMDEVRVTTHPI